MRYALSLGLALCALTPAARAELGRLRISVPADATVTINGVVSTSQTAERVIQSQDLEPGKEYFYEVEATATRNGVPYTEKRTVSVEAGYETTLTFNFPAEQAAPAYTPQPAYTPPAYSGGVSPYQGGYYPGMSQRPQPFNPGMQRPQPFYPSGPGQLSQPGGYGTPPQRPQPYNPGPRR